ncbi:hypothetical protein Taro_009516 [Colocasia esculenta]|uniref:Uncharacterized protein n=1 Tax=Colocasia esculenta TaxID=4460 RepID=A0A843U5Y6_COLES|nr:hypothetical protein [Colocasia esculenta]
MAQVPVGLPGSSCPLMVEYVAWDGYNRAVSRRTCSEPFGDTIRASDPHRGSNMLFGDIQGCSAQQDGAKCGGVILFGPEPNGPPLERERGETIAGEDEDLQDQKRIRGAR